LKKIILFILPALIWGSTWLAIKFQLGVVDPLISIFYRFLFAAALLLIYIYYSKKNLKYSLKEHLLMALLGALLFGINYWLVYLAEMHLESGLVAVVFSTIIFLNIFNSAIFLKTSIKLRIILSAIIGFVGVGFVFKEELFHFSFSSETSFSFFIALLGAISASLGNILSAYLQKNKLPVMQTNAYAMLYGALLMLLLALLIGSPFTFDFSFPYISSLLYLAIFGSVVAFGSYLTLLGQIGPGKAGYITLVIPVIALILSTIFESYEWTLTAMLGVILILTGNVLILYKRKFKENGKRD